MVIGLIVQLLGFIILLIKMKKAIIILTVLFCLVPLVYADVKVGLSVDWTPFVATLYKGRVCVDNTNLFGVFDSIILEYSQNYHSNSAPSSRDLFLQNQGNNTYCAELEPTYWDSTHLADTLDNAKLTVKNKGDVIFQGDKWSADVPVGVNNPNHLFHSYGATFNMRLNPGWNLISIPLSPSNNSVEAVFGSVNYSGLFSYDSGWKVPVEVNVSRGYWININDESTLSVWGSVPEISMINLLDGWNLIGVPFDKNITDISDNISAYSYNNSKWYSYNSNRLFNNLDKFIPGLGYWVLKK